MTSKQEEKLRDQLKSARRLNDWLKAHTTHWCPIVSSKKIKQILVDRCNELGVSMYEVALRADVSWNTVKKYYLNCDDPESRPSLRQEDLVRMGELIGVKIKVQVILDDPENVDRKKLLNEKFIPRGKRKRNKKVG